jgi:hypothetical protein
MDSRHVLDSLQRWNDKAAGGETGNRCTGPVRAGAEAEAPGELRTAPAARVYRDRGADACCY